MILTATGHRPPKLGGYYVPNPVYSEVVGQLRAALRTLNPELVLTGMSLGVDQWVAEICISEGIPFDAIIPFHGYQSNWPRESQRTFEVLCAHANSVYVVTNTHQYNGNLLFRRNAFMVDRCDRVLAVFNGVQEGGTWNTVQYAHARGKPTQYVNINMEMWRLAAEIAERDRQRRERRAAQLAASARPAEQVIRDDAQEIQRRVGQELQGFVGRRATPATREEIMRRMDRLITELQRRGTRITGNVLEPHVGVDFAVGEDQTAVRVVESAPPAPAAQPAPVQEQETTSTEKRFQPGRVIDIEDK
jgi:uncharacterized phage-like protein YoqJ